MSPGSGFFPPSASCGRIPGDAFGKAVYLAEVELSRGKSLSGSFFREFPGFLILLPDALAAMMPGSKFIPGNRIALFRRVLQLFKRSGKSDGKPTALHHDDK